VHKRQVKLQPKIKTPSNGETAATGRRGAPHTLARLEEEEQESFCRLQRALQTGDRFEIDACQVYWLKVAETLRRSDASIEISRRSLEEQVPKKLASDVAFAISDWLRVSFMIFLSSEGMALMAIRNFATWKHYALQRFVGILHMTVRNSLRTNSPIPDWAATKVRESWNVQEPWIDRP
jgi:hypothetical protein